MSICLFVRLSLFSLGARFFCQWVKILWLQSHNQGTDLIQQEQKVYARSLTVRSYSISIITHILCLFFSGQVIVFLPIHNFPIQNNTQKVDFFLELIFIVNYYNYYYYKMLYNLPNILFLIQLINTIFPPVHLPVCTFDKVKPVNCGEKCFLRVITFIMYN